MKHKLICLAAAAALVLCACGFSLLDHYDAGKRVHQHQTELPAACTSHGDEVFCSHLPLLLIETGDKTIPGEFLYDADGLRLKSQHTTTPEGAPYVSARLQVLDTPNANHHLTDTPTLTTQTEIRIRGNSSREHAKKNYALRPTTDDGTERVDISLLGMDAHDEWALHGPFLDKSLIRNYLWCNLAGEIMDYAPNVRFCEVFLDGQYQGLYLLSETVSSGKDVRLALNEPEQGVDAVSYAVRLDRGSDDPEKNIPIFSNYAYLNPNVVDIVYPGARQLTPGRIAYIQNDLSAFEKTLYSYDYNDASHGYQHLIDTGSFVDYFILSELSGNYDAGSYSTYLYKDVRGKFRLCVWDFNSACDNYAETPVSTEDLQMQNRLWFRMLTQDAAFTESVVARYHQLRRGVLSDDSIQQYIDDTVAYLGPAIDRNFQVWGDWLEQDLLMPAQRNVYTHAEAVAQLKTFCTQRGDWLDQHIESVLQFGHPSKVKQNNLH